MNEPLNFYPHPEWKRLYEALEGEVTYGQLLTYERIKEISGLDIMNPEPKVATRARAQFQRWRREMLVKRQVHFEPVPKQGYRAVEPREQLPCGGNRVKRGWSRFKDAERIIINTRLDLLTDKERTANIEAQVHVQLVLEHAKERHHAITTGKMPPRLPSPMLDRFRSRVEPPPDANKD